MLAAVRGPSTWAPQDAPATLDDRLWALTEEPVADSDEGRRTAVRHRLARQLLDDPVVYIDDLGPEARAYFINQRGPMAARLCEATGLMPESRAEGLALVDAGTGKSKVLSLTLPFLLDAQVKPSRIEPDGDAGKRMSWNLLMGTHPRRMGYAWLEFGRVADDGVPQYLTLGAGLFAAESKPQVDCWYFIIEGAPDAPRINQDIWLTSEQRVVLTLPHLRERLQGRGQVFETARSYRRAVDERLFHLGEQRYSALMDTLIQLRQPQLSKDPDEGALPDALSEALPPLSPDLVSDVADAMGQLEEYQALAKAVSQFERRYRVYAGTRSRREAALLRAAQTEHDNASRARNEAQALLEAAERAEVDAKTAYEGAELALKRAQARLETLRADPTNRDANRLENAEQDAQARRRAFEEATRAVEKAELRLRRDAEDTRRLARCGDRGETCRCAPGERGPRRCGRHCRAPFRKRPRRERGGGAGGAAGAEVRPGLRCAPYARDRAPQGHSADPRPSLAGDFGGGCARSAARGARRKGGGGAGRHRAA